MKNRLRILLVAIVVAAIASIAFVSGKSSVAQTKNANVPADFDKTAALAQLREMIKGKEQEPAEKVFKNIQTLKGVPAARVLGIMDFGYSRSLGVDCTHCHVPDKWESDEKRPKGVTREMVLMVGKINNDLLKSIKGLASEKPTVNCTTCHRGEIKPATNMQASKS